MDGELSGENAGERPRVIRFKNRRLIDYDWFHFPIDENRYLSFWMENLASSPAWVVQLSRISKTYGVMVEDKESCNWRLEFDIFLYVHGQLIVQLDCNLASGEDSQNVKEIFSQVDKRSHDRRVNMKIKFRRIEGLGVEPLRDYHTPSTDTDVALVVAKKKFYVVKKVLAEKSPFFETLFNGPFKEKSQSEVLIEDVSEETMTALLDVVDGQFYCPPSKEDLVKVLDASDRFLLTSVTEKIEDYLINIEEYGFLTEGDKQQLAEKYDMESLKATVRKPTHDPIFDGNGDEIDPDDENYWRTIRFRGQLPN